MINKVKIKIWTVIIGLVLFGGVLYISHEPPLPPFHGDVKPKIKIPSDLTDLDKIEYLYAAQEKLRREHNLKGEDYREGRITEAEWNDYLENDFKGKSRYIGHQVSVLVQKEIKDLSEEEKIKKQDEFKEGKKSKKYEIDLDNL